jgi:hypothetical protein
MNAEIITPDQATERGLRVLAGPYFKCEEWMIDAVLADMRRGNIEASIVENANGQREVWRSVSGFREVCK